MLGGHATTLSYPQDRRRALGNIRVSMPARWSRVELLVIDELGYVPLAEVAAELLTIEHFAETAGVAFRVSSPPK